MLGTTANTYTGTSIALAAADTCSGVRRLALSLPSVKTIDGATQAGTIREPIRCLADRVVQRRGPERRNRFELAWKVFQAVCERRHLGQPGVECEDGGFVLRLVEPAEHVACGVAGIGKPRFHAAADVEEQRHADLAAVSPEFGDLSGDSAVDHFEVADRQIADEASLPVADDGVQADEVDPGLEGGDRLVLGSQKSGWRQHQSCRHSDSKDECAPRHRTTTISKYTAKR